MPTNKAVNKRAGFASGQKSGLKKRFDLTNKKVRFFVVIGIFAILGGGYFTVRSFASTTVRTWTGNQIYKDTWIPNTCQATSGTEPGKNNAPTMDIVCRSYIGGQFLVPGVEQIRLEQGSYQACVNAKGSGNIRIGLRPYASSGVSRQHKMINDGSYRSYCSHNSTFSAGQKPNIEIFINPDTGQNPPPALVKVMDVKLQKYAPTTPAPAPAPSK